MSQIDPNEVSCFSRSVWNLVPFEPSSCSQVCLCESPLTLFDEIAQMLRRIEQSRPKCVLAVKQDERRASPLSRLLWTHSR